MLVYLFQLYAPALFEGLWTCYVVDRSQKKLIVLDFDKRDDEQQLFDNAMVYFYLSLFQYVSEFK